MQLQNKVIILTGGASGIGLETAKLLVARGARLIIIDKNKINLNKLQKLLPGCTAIHCDLTEVSSLPAIIRSICESLPKVDVLINNAGIGYHGPIVELEPESIDYVMRLNATTPAILMNLMVPYMKPGSRIINVGSPVASYFSPGFSVYAGSKNALKSITRIGRRELKRHGIVVTLFYPFITWSDYAKNALYTPSFAPWTRQNLPAWPDSAVFSAHRLLASLESRKATFKARPDWYFAYAVIKQKLHASR